MQHPEEELLGTLKSSGADFLCTLPCDRVKNLIALSDREFYRVPLTREEEGVGICAGAALAGRRPAMIVQGSGVGNMINALLSLTGFYALPLALLVSWRGIYKEGIAAQIPMGRALPDLLLAAGIGVTELRQRKETGGIHDDLQRVYKENRIHAFLMSPALWEESGIELKERVERRTCENPVLPSGTKPPEPWQTRFEFIKALRAALEGNVVVSNLGVPSKELYQAIPQPSNFYMLGSMGMATPIGLGIALSTERRVFVIDGDGSILMNAGALATVALTGPENLTIIAMDNASYGSTGSQPTPTGSCVDLEAVARGFGIKNTLKTADPEEIASAIKPATKGPFFVHAIALPGNARVPDIPLGHLEVKHRFMEFLRA